MCVYCEQNARWEKEKLPYHKQKDITANLKSNILDVDKLDGEIKDYHTCCPQLVLTNSRFFDIAIINIPIKYCPECGRKLGK